MKFDSAKHSFVESGDGLAFYPWAGLSLVGALWAYEVPSEASRQSLARLARFQWTAGWACMAIAVPIGVYLGLHVVQVALFASIVSIAVLSAFAVACVRNLTRIPIGKSLRVFGVRMSEVHLTQGVMMGVLCLIMTFLFRMFSPVPLALVAFFVTNAGLSLYVLRQRQRQ